MTSGIYVFAVGVLLGSIVATACAWWWLSDKAVIPREFFTSTEAAPERPIPSPTEGTACPSRSSRPDTADPCSSS